jgi:iron complex transport system substrate-binding protein
MNKKGFLTKIAVILLVVAMLFSSVACSNTQTSDKQPSTQSSETNGTETAGTETTGNETTGTETATSDSSNEPIVVTDQLGRQITITDEVTKIVSGYYITTSLLIALGLEDKIVGVEAKAGSRPIYSLAAPEILNLPNVGTAKQFDLEGCLALKPDLVILPIKLKDSIETLEKSGVNVIGVNPEDMELLKETITLIGKATGADNRARKLIEYYDKKIGEISNLTKDASAQKNIYLAGNSDMLSTATSKMYQSSLIEAAGGKNVASDIDDTYWATISYEQLLAYNPDIIIIVPFAEYTKEDVLKDSKLQSINAVKNKAVYKMPESFEAWDSPVPSGILGTMWLTSILHENKYPFDKFMEDAAEFYKEFYDFEINKEEITK